MAAIGLLVRRYLSLMRLDKAEQFQMGPWPDGQMQSPWQRRWFIEGLLTTNPTSSGPHNRYVSKTRLSKTFFSRKPRP